MSHTLKKALHVFAGILVLGLSSPASPVRAQATPPQSGAPSSVLPTGGGAALLDPSDIVFLLLDHQSGLFQTVKDVPVAELRSNVVMLARLGARRLIRASTGGRCRNALGTPGTLAEDGRRFALIEHGAGPWPELHQTSGQRGETIHWEKARPMSDAPISRGFRRLRSGTDAAKSRVPPGQYLTSDFPVLSAGPTPRTFIEDWSFALQHGGSLLARWSWAEFQALPQTRTTVDIHCVTKWSKLDTEWEGVTIDDLLKAAGLDAPPAPFAMAHSDGAYTANLPLVDLLGGRAMVATRYAGLPLAPEHGGPARLLVPHLYFWKSAKWVRRLRFMERDAPGFWESLGYHNYGDPWREQRYDGD